MSSPQPLPRVLRGLPRWMLAALIGILALAALLYTWNIGYSGLSTYYAAAARSMATSWHAFAFGSLDRASTTTLDKLSGFLVPQALFIRLFGFHAWALSLPQAVEGVVTVFVAYLVGARWRGPAFGLATAFVLATTPMLAAMFGKPMEDGMLTMTMVLAFAAWQRAVLGGRWQWLLLAGAWVAVGFQAKMLQAWLILPALAIGYLIAVAGPWRVRLLRVLAAGAVTVLLSLGWVTAIQLVPAAHRPFIDGSTNDNTYSMVFGYNGVDRILPDAIPGAVPQLDSARGAAQSPANVTGAPPPNHTATSDAGHSVAKMVLPEFTTQIGWLYPAAIAGVAFLLAGLLPRLPLALRLRHLRRRPGWSSRPPLRQESSRRGHSGRLESAAGRADAGTTAALVLWTVVTAAVLSVAFVPHATYFAVIALPLALLAVFGAREAARRYRAGARIPLIALVAAQTLWCAVVVLTAPAVFHWVAAPVLLLGAAAVALLRRPHPRALRRAMLAAIAAALLGPVVWSLCVLGPGGGGSASDAYAGPRPHAVRRLTAAGPPPAIRRPFAAPPSPRLDAAQRRLVAYITPRNHGRRWLFATDTMAIAVSFALYTNYEAVPMGGFSRQAPDPRLHALRADLTDSRLRFVLLASPRTPAPPNAAIAADRSWVVTHCTPTLRGSFRDGSRQRQTLYDCAAVHRAL